ncbi:formylglycine-generating enzyme required for sulfatase activity [Streptomyces sp. LBL]|uniref:formylglycine-generating enzyme family protein n=1 Tax=Streptomyces sp. LBL TaxID=2940562 RepID=UPI0024767F43|nr:SUMF1/EgtB/PvdO family nonheme iron enzyme [Streptomyces sp. LBL]MDH6624117.1 formylglycine-generating enzyme required for sulfatase activity [Streptomyces sp. LBL]
MFLNGHELVDIPEGMSCLGSSELDPYAGELEFPMREVYVSAFRMARHPTTRRQLAVFRRAAGWEHPSDTVVLDDPAAEHQADLPAVNVSWELAQEYCGWLGERSGLSFALPTEAEWEKAARGGDDRIWPWGDEFRPELCNSAERAENGAAGFVPVHELAEGQSPYGCLHMAGGVWEWCEDYYHSHAHQEAEFIDPFAARPASQRVVKGGSAYCTKEIVRPACRDWTNSYNQGGADDGFRVCVRTWR